MREITSGEYEHRGPGRAESYPWDQLFNGSLWEVDAVEEFGVTRESFARAARRAAERKELIVEVHESGQFVTVQAKVD